MGPARGESNPSARLTKKQALSIYGDDSRTAEEMAKAYGVSVPNIRAIKSGRTWAHVTGHKTGAKK